MYSWEIENLLKLKNYVISNKDYFNICNTSPQINTVNYVPVENNFYIGTKDNFNFKFKVYRKEKSDVMVKH